MLAGEEKLELMGSLLITSSSGSTLVVDEDDGALFASGALRTPSKSRNPIFFTRDSPLAVVGRSR
jgi:glutamine synthetase type III